jgi:hypothetical protein
VLCGLMFSIRTHIQSQMTYIYSYQEALNLQYAGTCAFSMRIYIYKVACMLDKYSSRKVVLKRAAQHAVTLNRSE